MDFGRPNVETDRKMANGQLLFLGLGGDNSKSCIVKALNTLKDSRKKFLPRVSDKSHHPTSSFVFPLPTALYYLWWKSFNSWTCQSCTKIALKWNLRTSTFKNFLGGHAPRPPSISMPIALCTMHHKFRLVIQPDHSNFGIYGPEKWTLT